MSVSIARFFKSVKLRVGLTDTATVTMLGVMLTAKGAAVELLVHQEFGEGFTVRYKDPLEPELDRQWRRVVYQGMPFMLLPGKKEALEIAENLLRASMDGSCWEMATTAAVREWAVTMGVGWEEWKRETWDSWMRRYGSLRASASKPVAAGTGED
jgi:hypothetical protein